MLSEIELFEYSDSIEKKGIKQFNEKKKLTEIELINENSEYLEVDENPKEKQYYVEAINDIFENHGNYMPKNRIEQLNEIESLDQVRIYSIMEYKQEFPDIPNEVLAHYDSMQDIICIKESDDNNILKHSTTHETLHRTSFNGVREVQSQDSVEFVNCSGVRETGLSINRNRGLNEGITEMFTLSSLSRRNENDAIVSINAYSDLRRITSELTDIVGIDVINQAYFKGEIHVLENKVNYLSNRLDGFEELNRWMDYIELNPYIIESRIAKTEITRMFIEMRRNK